uniref:WW domain-containing protein n=1 Tax=Chaetoceros debilis TaxID=122233 RepID=A0A7S3QE91_9STRA
MKSIRAFKKQDGIDGELPSPSPSPLPTKPTKSKSLKKSVKSVFRRSKKENRHNNNNNNKSNGGTTRTPPVTPSPTKHNSSDSGSGSGSGSGLKVQIITSQSTSPTTLPAGHAQVDTHTRPGLDCTYSQHSDLTGSEGGSICATASEDSTQNLLQTVLGMGCDMDFSMSNMSSPLNGIMEGLSTIPEDKKAEWGTAPNMTFSDCDGDGDGSYDSYGYENDRAGGGGASGGEGEGYNDFEVVLQEEEEPVFCMPCRSTEDIHIKYQNQVERNVGAYSGSKYNMNMSNVTNVILQEESFEEEEQANGKANGHGHGQANGQNGGVPLARMDVSNAITETSAKSGRSGLSGRSGKSNKSGKSKGSASASSKGSKASSNSKDSGDNNIDGTTSTGSGMSSMQKSKSKRFKKSISKSLFLSKFHRKKSSTKDANGKSIYKLALQPRLPPRSGSGSANTAASASNANGTSAGGAGASGSVSVRQKRPRWKCVHDPKSNRVYYYHTHTRQVTWSRPPGFIEWRMAYKKTASNANKNKNAAIVGGEANRFFYNVLTKETCWEMPEGFIQWKEVLDGNSGKVYYYNVLNKETTWTRPKVVIMNVNGEKVEYNENKGGGSGGMGKIEGEKGDQPLLPDVTKEAGSSTPTRGRSTQSQSGTNSVCSDNDASPVKASKSKPKAVILGERSDYDFGASGAVSSKKDSKAVPTSSGTNMAMKSNTNMDNHCKLAKLLSDYCPDQTENNAQLLRLVQEQDIYTPILKAIETLVEDTPFDELRLAIFNYVKSTLVEMGEEPYDERKTSRSSKRLGMGKGMGMGMNMGKLKGKGKENSKSQSRPPVTNSPSRLNHLSRVNTYGSSSGSTPSIAPSTGYSFHSRDMSHITGTSNSTNRINNRSNRIIASKASTIRAIDALGGSGDGAVSKSAFRAVSKSGIGGGGSASSPNKLNQDQIHGRSSAHQGGNADYVMKKGTSDCYSRSYNMLVENSCDELMTDTDGEASQDIQVVLDMQMMKEKEEGIKVRREQHNANVQSEIKQKQRQVIMDQQEVHSSDSSSLHLPSVNADTIESAYAGDYDDETDNHTWEEEEDDVSALSDSFSPLMTKRYAKEKDRRMASQREQGMSRDERSEKKVATKIASAREIVAKIAASTKITSANTNTNLGGRETTPTSLYTSLKHHSHRESSESEVVYEELPRATTTVRVHAAATLRSHRDDYSVSSWDDETVTTNESH